MFIIEIYKLETFYADLRSIFSVNILATYFDGEFQIRFYMELSKFESVSSTCSLDMLFGTISRTFTA